ncbi:phage replisome organizer N-terminal domain-containing protein [Aerococcaceae bacterium 50-4]
MAKRYYWLKLKNDFFEQKEIKLLRRIAGGDTYTVIYLKMLLVSLQNEGKIYYDGITDSIVEEIALEIDEDADNVQITLQFLTSKGLIEQGVDDDIKMMNIGEMIGSESASAARMRKHRNRKLSHSDVKALQSDTGVTPRLHQGDTEKEIEKDIEIEKDKEPQQEDIELKGGGDDINEAIDFYQQNFGVLNPYTAQRIVDACNTFDEEIVIKAMQIALENNARNYNYVKAILKRWYEHNAMTIEDIEALELEHKNKQAKKSYGKLQKESVAPKWLNQEDRQDKYQNKDTPTQSNQVNADDIAALEALKQSVLGGAEDS